MNLFQKTLLSTVAGLAPGARFLVLPHQPAAFGVSETWLRAHLPASCALAAQDGGFVIIKHLEPPTTPPP